MRQNDILEYVKAALSKLVFGSNDKEQEDVKITFLNTCERFMFQGAICAAGSNKGYVTLDDIYRVLDDHDGIEHVKSLVDDHLYWKLDVLDLIPHGETMRFPKGTFCIRKPVRV